MALILETPRLALREFEPGDYDDLCLMLRDAETMYAYEHAFSEAEARAWLQKQLDRYAADGFGLWAVILKATGALIGQCGLTWQEAGDFGRVLEVGYIFNRAYCTGAAPPRPRGPAGTTPFRSSARGRCSPSSAWGTRPPKTSPAGTA